MHERDITEVSLPTRKKLDEGEFATVRFLPFWRNLPDDDLFELRDYVSPYFRRSENRGLKL